MLQHKVYSLVPRLLSMSGEEPGNETSLYSVLVLVFILALPPTSSIWSLIIRKTKIEAREGLVSSPDLIRHVYRFQYNVRENWKRSVLGLVLGLGPRLGKAQKWGYLAISLCLGMILSSSVLAFCGQVPLLCSVSDQLWGEAADLVALHCVDSTVPTRIHLWRSVVASLSCLYHS